MIEVRKTDAFEAWFDALRDREARLRIQVRIDRLAFGNPGQHRTLAGGVCELKIDHGPAYRVYYTQRGSMLVILLRRSQQHGQEPDTRHGRQPARQLDSWHAPEDHALRFRRLPAHTRRSS